MAPMVDVEGKEIDDIVADREQRALMSDLMMDHEEPFHEQVEDDYLYEGEGDDLLLARDSLAKAPEAPKKARKSKMSSGNARRTR